MGDELSEENFPKPADGLDRAALALWEKRTSPVRAGCRPQHGTGNLKSLRPCCAELRHAQTAFTLCRYALLVAVARNNSKKKDQEIKTGATVLRKAVGCLKKTAGLESIVTLGTHVADCLQQLQKFRALVTDVKKTPDAFFPRAHMLSKVRAGHTPSTDMATASVSEVLGRCAGRLRCFGA